MLCGRAQARIVRRQKAAKRAREAVARADALAAARRKLKDGDLLSIVTEDEDSDGEAPVVRAAERQEAQRREAEEMARRQEVERQAAAGARCGSGSV